MMMFHWALIAASILGIVPIAIQAFQALKVKLYRCSGHHCSYRSVLYKTLRIRNCFIFTLIRCLPGTATLNKTRSAIKELTEMAPKAPDRWKMENSGSRS